VWVGVGSLLSLNKRYFKTISKIDEKVLKEATLGEVVIDSWVESLICLG